MEKKLKQLGMPIGTASNRLKKILIFEMAKKLDLLRCYRCKRLIETPLELSIDHKIDWLDSGRAEELFFDLNNIAFSHHSCNCSAGRRENKITSLDDPRITHGNSGYKRGCRCSTCKKWKQNENERNRA